MNKSSVSIVEKMILNAEEKEQRIPILTMRNKSSDAFVFGCLTFFYIVCELFYNRLLLQVASDASSSSALDWVEKTGRSMAGLGLALVLWRIRGLNAGYKRASFDWRGFSFCILFSIPLMWLTQEVVIRELVRIAAPVSMKSAAVSVMARKMSFSSTSFLDGFSSLSKDEIKEKDIANTECRKALPYFLSGEKNSVGNKVNQAIFSALLLNDDRKQKILADIIINQADCALEKTPLTIKKMHEFYSEKTEYLKTVKVEYFSASEKLIQYQKSRWSSKRKAESMWRQGMDKFFGFDTTIPWGLSSEQFDKHIDVAKMVGKQAGFDFPLALNLNLNDFKLALKKAPFFLIDSPDYSFKEKGYLRKNGEISYKSTIVPVIGFFLSLFFGVFNLFMFIYNLIFRVSKLKNRKMIPFVFLIFLTIFPVFFGINKTSFSSNYWDQQPFLFLVLTWVVPSELVVENFIQ